MVLILLGYLLNSELSARPPCSFLSDKSEIRMRSLVLREHYVDLQNFLKDFLSISHWLVYKKA